MDMIDLGKTLKERRKAMGMSQQAVASPNGMSRVTVSNLENGKLPEIGLRKVLALCSTLGMDLVLKEASSRPTLRDLVAERDRNPRC